MTRKHEKETVSLQDLCAQAFSRCSNWPDVLGQVGLAQGLGVAAARYGLRPEEIVGKCREVSAFCPTDHDIFRIAIELAEERGRRTRGAQYWNRPEKCAVCHDSGWLQTTRNGYECAGRCPAGCAVPEPEGRHLTPEALR
jgi:hypothetical protein